MRENEYKENPNFMLAAFCGILTAIALAAIWAYSTYFTNFQMGWMAVAVGYIIGYVICLVGKGKSQIFGILGAILSLATCFAGNVFYIVLCLAKNETTRILEVAHLIGIPVIIDIYKDSFHASDLVFYGIALYEGYKLSIVRKNHESPIEVTV